MQDRERAREAIDAALRERRLTDAERDCATLLRQWPGDVDAWLLAGRAARAQGRAGEAVDRYQRAATLAPDRSDAWRALGAAAIADRQLDLAEHAAQRLAGLEPGSAEAWFDLGHVRWLKRDAGAAREAWARALALDPAHLRARWMHAHVPSSLVFADDAAIAAFLASWRDCIAYFEQLDGHAPGMGDRIEAAISQMPDFYLHYLGDEVDREHRRHAAMVRSHARIVRPDVEAPARAANVAPRIGFVSRFFHRHSVAKAFERLVTALPPRFDVALFQLGRRSDEVTARFVRRARVHVAADARPATWRKLIVEQHVDVLVYLDIGMDGIASWLAAQRLAPVQCALWGHPVATGYDCIDHYLSSDAAERADADDDYVERLVRLPGVGCWFEPPSVPQAAPRARDDTARFLVAQSVSKITPRHDALYARILAALPDARLDIVGIKREPWRAALDARVRATCAAAGVDGARLQVHARLPLEEFLARVATSDVNLDTVGFSGGISSLELLWLDTPTVTLPGRTLRSRQTAGMLQLLELPQLIARDEDDYVRIAIELGRSRDLRDKMRGLIAGRKHRLYRDERVPEGFAAFLDGVVGARTEP